jgi:SAM-dependent methyltransferase
MIPGILKKAVLMTLGPPVKYIISQMGIHDEVNHKINFIEQTIQDIYPDQWIFSEETLQEIERLKCIFELPDSLDMGISKNDMMVRHYINNGFDVKAATRAYLVRGLGLMDIVEKVAERKWGRAWPFKIGPFLDFASGYGTLERHLVHYISADDIYTSDIKEMGIRFQTEKFKVNGISSSFRPEEFEPGIKFKFIFVASLFSHLPENLFIKWLKQLWDNLDNEGVLVFTVHDISLITAQTDFFYSPVSEDSHSVVKDRLLKPESYGTAYVSEEFLRKCFEEMGLTDGHYARYRKCSGGLQDVYIVSRGTDRFEGIRFNTYDSELI